MIRDRNQAAVTEKVIALKKFYHSGTTRPLAYRLNQLRAIKRFLRECESEIEAALYQDLRKPAMESFATEIAIVATELNYAIKYLSTWMKPTRVHTTIALRPGKSQIYPEPLGTVLIIAPWNYPIQLTLVPLIGAIAAGNCVVLKPSEMTPITSSLLATKLPMYLDDAVLKIVEGGAAESTALLKEKFDHIFFTGSATVGRQILEAAASKLTPVTLELGGKSPCIVDDTVDLDVAARRIVWAKFTNAGQSCVAPDYVLVHESIEHLFVEKVKKTITQFYGDNPELSSDYGRIVSVSHCERLQKLLSSSGQVVMGGTFHANERYMAPTVLRNVDILSPIMQEEIFGPILPIIRYNKIDDVISYMQTLAKPLAVYLFTSNKTIKNKIIAEISSGTMCINHAMQQLAIPALPFGGVGASGMGAYHGKASFSTFTHYKSVFSKATWADPKITYPPYRERLRRLLRWFL